MRFSVAILDSDIRAKSVVGGKYLYCFECLFLESCKVFYSVVVMVVPCLFYFEHYFVVRSLVLKRSFI
jgi:hypothetical protein